MVANMISRAAVLLAASASVVSAGSAIVQNQCNFPVYLWSVSDVAGPMQSLAANGGEYTEAYRTNPDGGGVSIKIASTQAAPNVTQFEYTLEGSALWYDLSNINGYPFESWGVNVIPSDSSCNQVICPAGIELCAAAYNIPTDDFATAECSSSADMVVVLCSGAEDTTPISTSLSTVVASTTSAASSSVVSVATSTKTPSSSSTSIATSTVVTSSSIKSTSSVPVTTEVSSSTKGNGVVVQTTFVTQVVTVVAGSDSTTTLPSPHWGRPTGLAKRHARQHRHGHGHQF